MSKKKNKTKKEMLEDYDLYKEQTNDKCSYTYYTNYEYLSYKDRENFDNKFSKPKNNSQENYLKMLNKKQLKIVVSTGPAGTGKTLLATENAIKKFLLGKCDKIIFTRPSVSVDEELGFLPGTLEEKMAPWIRPIYDVLHNFIHPSEVKELLEEKLIEIAPLGYMRGRTFKNCWIIADEMQNSTISQMKMLLTRIGENTKLVITGDLDQNDRPSEINGLEDFLNKFKGRRSDSIGSVEFDRCDIEREEVVKEVLEIYGSNDIPILYKDILYETELIDTNIEEPDLKISKIKSACSLQQLISKIEISEYPINSFKALEESSEEDN